MPGTRIGIPAAEEDGQSVGGLQGEKQAGNAAQEESHVA